MEVRRKVSQLRRQRSPPALGHRTAVEGSWMWGPCPTSGEDDGTSEPVPARDEDQELAAAGNPGVLCGEDAEVGGQLCRRRNGAARQSRRLQAGLAEHLCPHTELLRECDECVSAMRQRIASDSERLRLRAQEQLDKVEIEWKEFMALRQHVAVSALSRFLGKQAAQDKVESTLAAEQLRQDKLIELRLKHIKLRIKIQRLEAELTNRKEHSRDPLQLQFEQLRALKLEQRKLSEKQSKESSKLQNKISSSLEVLSNVKEKLFRYQMEVQCKQEQLAEVEASLARERDLLTRTKHARNSLQRDNLRLKECQGLLGNRVLLQDFEKTVDASDHLEEQLENLKCQTAEINLKLFN